MLPTAQTVLNLNEVTNRVFGASQWYTDYRVSRKILEVTVYWKYKGRGVRSNFTIPATSMSYEEIAPAARQAYDDTREWVEETPIVYHSDRQYFQ